MTVEETRVVDLTRIYTSGCLKSIAYIALTISAKSRTIIAGCLLAMIQFFQLKFD